MVNRPRSGTPENLFQLGYHIRHSSCTGAWHGVLSARYESLRVGSGCRPGDCGDSCPESSFPPPPTWRFAVCYLASSVRRGQRMRHRSPNECCQGRSARDRTSVSGHVVIRSCRIGNTAPVLARFAALHCLSATRGVDIDPHAFAGFLERRGCPVTRQRRVVAAQVARNPRFMILPWAMIAGFGASIIARDWTLLASAIGLWVVWRLLPREQGPPVFRLALTFQWVQVTAGLWYLALTSRRIFTMDACDYQPMVLLGLLSIVFLVLGLRWGTGRVRQGSPSRARRMRLPLSAWHLFVADLIMVLLTGAGLILADRYSIF